MRLLFLALEAPLPADNGGRLRTFHLLQQAAQAHEITFVAFGDPPSGVEDDADANALERLCQAVYYLPRPQPGRPSLAERWRFLAGRRPLALRLYRSPAMARCLRELLVENQYDLIHVDQIYLAQYAPDLRRHAPSVLNHNDVEATTQRRLLWHDAKRFRPIWWVRWLEHWQWQAFERRSLPWFDVHLAVSEQDAAYFRQHSARQVGIVPNGVDTQAWQPRPEFDGPPSVLFVGSLDYRANADGALWFTQAIWPRVQAAYPTARLTIVGRQPPADVLRLDGQAGIAVAGTVADVRPYYQAAHVMIVPLRAGGGTRLKILEALALGVPVVATPQGVEGLELTPGRDLLVAKRPAEFAAAVNSLLGDRPRREQLAAAGRERVCQQYDWRIVGRTLLDAYQTARQHYQQRRTQLAPSVA